MAAQAELLSVYGQWEELTRAEGRAIEAAAWPLVSRLQTEKHVLQEQIVNASQRLEAEVEKGSPRWNTFESDLRKVVERLILLEMRNGEILAAKRAAAEAERRELDKTGRNLRQVHGAYASRRSETWASYS